MPKDSLRPISLTCTDYKIGAGVIAARIQKVIKSIVNTDQSAYIQVRGSFQTLRLIEDVIWFTRNCNVSGILLTLDYSQAFDSLSKELKIDLKKLKEMF